MSTPIEFAVIATEVDLDEYVSGVASEMSPDERAFVEVGGHMREITPLVHLAWAEVEDPRYAAVSNGEAIVGLRQRCAWIKTDVLELLP